jgi:hypothetical protein
MRLGAIDLARVQHPYDGKAGQQVSPVGCVCQLKG